MGDELTMDVDPLIRRMFDDFDDFIIFNVYLEKFQSQLFLVYGSVSVIKFQ